MVEILYAKGQLYLLAHSPLLEQITSNLIGIIMKHLSTIQQMLMMMVCQITQVIYFINQKNYSGTNKDSYALNFGISATFSIPLDRGFQNQCKSAADTQISIQKQVLENKRLDWQIARIRECGKLKQEGIMLTTDSPFFNICKDVYLVPKANQVLSAYSQKQ